MMPAPALVAWFATGKHPQHYPSGYKPARLIGLVGRLQAHQALLRLRMAGRARPR